ncbi:hypothetical protein [Marmoricola sp. RAF53]|uniref:hypothetical protein n=1 Tax=Marmoricola sp. RAF53 TaxID=3233059 RepID=UPI003F9942A0
MKIFVVVAALVLVASGCSSDGDGPEAKSLPAESSTAPDPRDGVHCLPVAASTVQRIVAGQRKGIHLVPGRAVALKSPDVDGVYFVALQFKVAGAPETQLGVWEIESAVLDGSGAILATDGPARRFTRWPAASVSASDHNVGEVKACQLV